MSLTPNSQFIANANAVIGVAQQLGNLQSQLQGIVSSNTVVPFGNGWATMATTALTTDGNLGTADGSPNEAHPIDPRVYAGLSATLNASQLANLLALCVSANNLLLGQAVGANGATPGTLASVQANP